MDFEASTATLYDMVLHSRGTIATALSPCGSAHDVSKDDDSDAGQPEGTLAYGFLKVSLNLEFM